MELNAFVSGATAMGSAVAGLLFLRFFRRSGDRLFAFFAAAFGLLGCDRVALVLLSTEGEFGYAVYLLRLAAFLLILVGIVDKNLVARQR